MYFLLHRYLHGQEQSTTGNLVLGIPDLIYRQIFFFIFHFQLKLPTRYEGLITVFFIFGWNSSFLQFWAYDGYLYYRNYRLSNYIFNQ